MYLKYFEPIPNHINIIDNLLDYQLGKNISILDTSLSTIENQDIALIGIGKTVDVFRTYFYQLSYNFKNINIIDLGNLKSTDINQLNNILEHCLSKKTLPIVISDTNISAEFISNQTQKHLNNIIVVDKEISLSQNDKIDSNNLYNSILLDNSDKIFNFGLIGYQSYFIDSKVVSFLSNKNYDYLRLGNLKKNIELSEPLIRDADFMSFNLAALKKIEVPSCSQASPSGLFVEEACQLTYYAGISDKMNFLNIHGYDLTIKNESQTAQAISQMVWYFIYGYSNRKYDYPVSMNNFKEFIVDFRKSNYQITFWKSIKSDRWWMEVPLKEKSKTRHRLIPCSYEDYLEAGNGSLPERLLKAHQRFE